MLTSKTLQHVIQCTRDAKSYTYTTGKCPSSQLFDTFCRTTSTVLDFQLLNATKNKLCKTEFAMIWLNYEQEKVDHFYCDS